MPKYKIVKKETMCYEGNKVVEAENEAEALKQALGEVSEEEFAWGREVLEESDITVEKLPEPKLWEVDLIRKGYRSMTVTVEADDESEACQKACDESDGSGFGDEYDCDVEACGTRLLEEKSK